MIGSLALYVGRDLRVGEDEEPVVPDAGDGGCGNLVRLDPGVRIDEHVNDEVDVLVVVRAGSGTVTIGDEAHDLADSAIALIPARQRRSFVAGPGGFAYLSVHRRRGPLMP